MKSTVYILLKILDVTHSAKRISVSIGYIAERHIGLSREFVSLKLLRETCKDLAGPVCIGSPRALLAALSKKCHCHGNQM